MTDITPQKIEKMIYIVRGQKVMLDSYLANLYGVETKNLNRQVNRNKLRFPEDFAFKSSSSEWESLRCQSVTSNGSRGGRRYSPYVFTEHGIAMLSSILNSPKSIQVNISIVRTFIKMRKLLASDESLTDRLDQFEQGTDKLFKIVFERLDNVEENQSVLPRDRSKIRFK